MQHAAPSPRRASTAASTREQHGIAKAAFSPECDPIAAAEQAEQQRAVEQAEQQRAVEAAEQQRAVEAAAAVDARRRREALVRASGPHALAEAARRHAGGVKQAEDWLEAGVHGLAQAYESRMLKDTCRQPLG
jgi:uncharacterized membrane protein YqiK